MTGVSVTRPRGQDPLSLLLPIAADPEGTSKRLAELSKATAEHLKAIEAHGKIDEIDSLLAQAKADAGKKRVQLANARERAKEIVAEAEEQARQIIDDAGGKAAVERNKIKAAQERLKARESRVREKESKIDPLYAEAAESNERAQAQEAKAERTREAFERKIRILEEAIREATR